MIELYEIGIEIHIEESYSFGSMDNVRSYDNFNFGFEANEYTYTTLVGVRCSITGLNILLVVNGGVSVFHDTCYVIHDNRLVICVGNSVFTLSIIDFSISWSGKFDEATCFEIFRFEDGYLIHGELAITRINLLGNVIWRFSGRDIFVTPDGNDEITFSDKGIKLIDWSGKTYLLDIDGKIIG